MNFEIILTSSVVVALIELVKELIMKAINNRSVDKKALRLILMQSLRDLGCECIKNKCISNIDLECFNTMYDTYKKLGGDGYADKIYKDVNALPLELE